MARTKSPSSIEAAITRVKKQIVKTQTRLELLSEKLKELQQEKEKSDAIRIMSAFKKSKRSMRELMTFLGA